MNGLQLRDEAVRDRIRAAEEFLDPGLFSPVAMLPIQLTPLKVILLLVEAIGQTSF
jgi:hypothetical protein